MGRKALHGEAMTAAERQAKRRTGRQLLVANSLDSIAEIRVKLIGLAICADRESVDDIREQLDYIAESLGHLG